MMKQKASILLAPILAVAMTFGVAEMSPKASAVTHVEVKEGDTLWGISEEYDHITVNHLLASNPHVDPYALQIGTDIKIELEPMPINHDQELVTYLVKPGDTLWSIAQYYEGVTVQKLLHLNEGIDPYNLPVDMVLFIAVPEEPRMVYHTIQPGNTFYEIASAYDHVTVDDLRDANPNVNENELTISSKIVIPLD